VNVLEQVAPVEKCHLGDVFLVKLRALALHDALAVLRDQQHVAGVIVDDSLFFFVCEEVVFNNLLVAERDGFGQVSELQLEPSPRVLPLFRLLADECADLEAQLLAYW
jgi:hypothetical protein